MGHVILSAWEQKTVQITSVQFACCGKAELVNVGIVVIVEVFDTFSMVDKLLCCGSSVVTVGFTGGSSVVVVAWSTVESTVVPIGSTAGSEVTDVETGSDVVVSIGSDVN